MTVPQNDRTVQYTATGGEATFEYDFRILDDADLVVTREPSGGSLTTLTEGVDYTVGGVGDAGGGTVTLDTGVFPSGATAGDTWTLYSDTELSRATDFQTDGDFLADTVNDQLDDIIHMIQETDKSVQDSVARPRTSTETYDLAWPDGATASTKVLTITSSGLALSTPSDASVNVLPGSSTDNAVPKFDGTSGDTLQNSGVTIDDSNNLSANTFNPTDAATTRDNLGIPATTAEKSSNYTVVAADRGTLIVGTAAITISFAAAATLGDRFKCFVRADGADLILDPDASETIDGAATLSLKDTEAAIVFCDGTKFRTVKGGAGGGLFKGENGEVGSSAGDIFRVNEQTLNTDTTIDADENASAAGPLTVASGTTLTVSSGGNLSII